MAWKDLADSALKFAEKVLNDASLWFWLGVAAVALLFADSRGLIPLSRTIAEPRVGLTAVLVVVVALWLNALKVHRPLGRAASAVRGSIKDRQEKWALARRAARVAPGAETTLGDLLRTRCLERRWLLWFIAQLEGDPNLLLPYGTVLNDDEFEGARSLFTLGLLHRTGDNASALVFVHKQLWKAYASAIASDEALARQLQSERHDIESKGRDALKEQLPRYATERFFRRTGRVSAAAAT